MDPVALVYYGIVCGCLGLAAPRLNPGALRFAVGVVVGLAAAWALPLVRRALGV